MESVLIELDKPRHLRYDANAIADLEGIVGHPLSKILRMNTDTIYILRAWLWAGLRHEDHNLSLIRVGELIDGWRVSGKEIPVLAEKIAQAITLSGWIVIPKTGDPKNQQPPGKIAGL